MRSAFVGIAIAAFAVPVAAQEWQAKEAPIMTKWAKDVSPDNVLPEYPRPQMTRDKWTNLNGLWDYAIRGKDESQPDQWDGKILVPFAAESALSGVMKTVGSDSLLWYHRTFTVPADWKAHRVLLHFGAVDWRSNVLVNGTEVGSHEGGYDPFSFDITDALKEGENTIVVSVWDPSDDGTQPRGKQIKNPHGIWYTPVTGIWQTAWLEPVPTNHIESLEIVPRVEENSLEVTVATAGDGEVTARVRAGQPTINGNAVSEGEASSTGEGPANKPISVRIPNAKLWTPDEPHLYPLTIEILEGDKVVDTVSSYGAMRSIELKKADDGFNRMFLNGEPVFQYGPLDQGWWPDGLYTAPTDAALKFDIEMTKQLGFNMARKHVKVEPSRWYYWCDMLGLLVWQDMPNGDEHIPRGAPKDITRTEESEAIYRKEWKAIVEALDAHPCIVVWVPFNEGWGQFKTNEILAWTKELDPTRLVDGPSGWEDRGEGDMIDMHMYPGPGMFPAEEERATVLGEFGGLGWPVKDHLWKAQDNWGYRTYQSQEELLENYRNLMVQVPPLIGDGLAAAIYTQTTDVEIEVNGLMTYDREVIKFPIKETAALNKTVYGTPTKKVSVVPTSEKEPQTWKFTTEKPGKGWQQAEFDDSGWNEGPGGFGTKETPNTNVRTKWDSPDIWLRRTVEIPESLNAPAIQVYHDEHAQIFLNGKQIGARRGYTTGYVLLPLDMEARKAVQAGKNVIAVHCHQTEGGQYIDVGLVDLAPGK